MTDQEFDLMDELYFVKTFTELTDVKHIKHQTIIETLKQLLEQHWVKILDENDNEIGYNATSFAKNINNYHFIATKAGLLAHNGR